MDKDRIAESAKQASGTIKEGIGKATGDAKLKADTIFLHANVYTGVPANTPFSSILREEAIAVRGDRIQAVGRALDLDKLKGPQTQVVDLGGHFVMPGFNDAHLHLDDAGTTKLSVDLTGVKSLDDLRMQVANALMVVSALHIDYERRDIALEHGSDRHSTFQDFKCS